MAFTFGTNEIGTERPLLAESGSSSTALFWPTAVRSVGDGMGPRISLDVREQSAARVQGFSRKECTGNELGPQDAPRNSFWAHHSPSGIAILLYMVFRFTPNIRAASEILPFACSTARRIARD